ncbi:MAG: zinc ABC transporter substrate-binding protein [Pusillimonas sp.]
MPGLKKPAAIAALIAIALLALPQASAKELKVVSTFSIISDLAQNVGGEHIALTTLVGPDGDTHAYEPRPTDAVAVRHADVILANGLHLEGFLQRLVQASGGKAPVVALSKGVKLLNSADDHDHSEDGHNAHDHDDSHDHDHKHERDHKHDHGHSHEHNQDDKQGHHHHGEFDPHAWQSVENAQVYVANIADAFCAADSEGCPAYRANAASYTEKLKALDADIKASVEQIPADKRTLITSHDAFAYLGQEYGLRFLAPQGLGTDSEASAGDVAALIRQIKAQKAAGLFLENISNPRLIEQIAKETGMKIGGKLYSDALSAENGPAATYIDMMRHNIATIRDTVLEK